MTLFNLLPISTSVTDEGCAGGCLGGCKACEGCLGCLGGAKVVTPDEPV